MLQNILEIITFKQENRNFNGGKSKLIVKKIGATGVIDAQMQII